MLQDILLNTFAELDMILRLLGTQTFIRRGLLSIIGMKYESVALARRVAWQVSKDLTYNPHQILKIEGELSSKKGYHRMPGGRRIFMTGYIFRDAWCG